MDDDFHYINSLSIPFRLTIFAGFAVATHVVVIPMRQSAKRALSSASGTRYQEPRSIGTLATGEIVFTLFFPALGLILREFGVSLPAYLTSVSVIGLAIGFASQGVVQDVVTGRTYIFPDLVDAGDLVEISGQTGVLKAITMRFVELENALGATVCIANRSIRNVINDPRGYIRCVVDITLRGDEARRDAADPAG